MDPRPGPPGRGGPTRRPPPARFRRRSGTNIGAVDELWTCHLGPGRVPRGRRPPGAPAGAGPGRRAARPAAAARAPGRLHARAPLGARRPAGRRGVSARARDRGRADRARREAHLPRPGPARGLSDHARVQRARLRGDDGGCARRALGEAGVEADHARGPRVHRRLGRRAQDRLDRHPRIPRRVDARLRRQRGERPRAVRLGGGMRAARRAHDVAAPGGLAGGRSACFRKRAAHAFSRGLRTAPADRHARSGSARVPSLA